MAIIGVMILAMKVVMIVVVKVAMKAELSLKTGMRRRRNREWTSDRTDGIRLNTNG